MKVRVQTSSPGVWHFRHEEAVVRLLLDWRSMGHYVELGLLHDYGPIRDVVLHRQWFPANGSFLPRFCLAIEDCIRQLGASGSVGLILVNLRTQIFVLGQRRAREESA